MTEKFSTILEPAARHDWSSVSHVEYEAWCLKDGVDVPTDDELDQFYTHLLDRVQQDSSKIEAVKYVKDLNKGDNVRTYATKILLYQTALRAVDPGCLNQGPYGFCGPTAVLYDFAKHWPVRYAQCVIDLHCRRVARMKVGNGESLNLKADANFDREYDQAGLKVIHMGPADFVILHAIRRAAEESNVGSFTVAKPGLESEATKPSVMADLLRRAGYRDVTDATIWEGPNAKPDKKFMIDAMIKECATLTRSSVGPTVIVLSHPWLGVFAKNGTTWADFKYPAGGKEPGKLADLHWICVNSLQYGLSHVDMKFMTWGENVEGQYQRDEFKHCFYGYISAKP
jgi:hypothetical protein